VQDESVEFFAEAWSVDDAVHHHDNAFETRQGTGSVPVAHANPEAAIDDEAEERTEDGSGAASAGTAGTSTSKSRNPDQVAAGSIVICACLGCTVWPPVIVVGVCGWVALLYICVRLDSDKLKVEFETCRRSGQRMSRRAYNLVTAHGFFWPFLKTSVLVRIFVPILGRLISAYLSLSSDEQVDAIAIVTGVPILVGLRFPREVRALCSNSLCALATFYEQLTEEERLNPSDDNATALN
jgi:hypothetical protein